MKVVDFRHGIAILVGFELDLCATQSISDRVDTIVIDGL